MRKSSKILQFDLLFIEEQLPRAGQSVHSGLIRREALKRQELNRLISNRGLLKGLHI